MSFTWRLCVPTYKRQYPLILNMLSCDQDLVIDMFVREEDYESGFYDEMKTMDRVNVHSLGKGLHELGLTRDRIMQWCKDTNVDYCCMFDDGMMNVKNLCRQDQSISEVLDNACGSMRDDVMSENVIGFTFPKHIGYYDDGSYVVLNPNRFDDKKYFLVTPVQAFIIDVKKYFDCDVRFKSVDEVGYEDCAFFADCVKKGLVFLSRRNIVIDGVAPNAPKKGGSHADVSDIKQNVNERVQHCVGYVGNMCGMTVEERYRGFANCTLPFVVFNVDYFREVLCEKRNENKEIIDRQFIRRF